MEEIISLKVFGTEYKFKADENVKNAQAAGDMLQAELTKAEEKLNFQSSAGNQMAALLLATLNLAKEYYEAKNQYEEIKKQVNNKANKLLKTVEDGIIAIEYIQKINGNLETKNIISKNTSKQFDPEIKRIKAEKENEQTEDIKIEDIKIEDIKIEDIKIEDIKTEDIKTEDIKTEDIKTEDIKIEDIKTEDIKTEDIKTEDIKIEDNKNTNELIEEYSESTDTIEEIEEIEEEIQSQQLFSHLSGIANKNTNEKDSQKTVVNVLKTSFLNHDFKMPPIHFLDINEENKASIDNEYLNNKARLLENKLNDFGIKGDVVNILPGPVITTFEYRPAPGIKISKIANLSDDLALALKALSVRIVAPIPGKDVIGIEIPNDERHVVRLREIVDSEQFRKLKSKLTLCLGKDIVGNPVSVEMDKMPHLLIAGATGTGKSVALNSMITSLLYKANPDEVKLIMIDPKRIELSFYNGIPHLITPVVTDMKKATNALAWAVREMENRYSLLAESQVRNITQYNHKITKINEGKETAEKLPYIVVIIDELADLMMVASRDVESYLMRLAQMARASGIHIILATQRPSVDVLTGVIKANFPTRISFQVSSKTDSRTIIDTNGAETLLGNGDMLFMPPGTAKLQRIHGAFISEEELKRVITFLKDQRSPEYIDAITEIIEDGRSSDSSEDYDEKYDEAVMLVTKTRQASISSIQRNLRIGYNRAARIVEMMEKEGIIGPADGVKPREVLVKNMDE
ncbi:MAG: cell division protein ZapA [Desulfobacterales bacterium]|nr:cell division protein ZapA [Desulfobacterales bacterium]